MRYTHRDAVYQGQKVASFWDSRGSGQLRLLDALGHICASIQRRREANVTYRGPLPSQSNVANYAFPKCGIGLAAVLDELDADFVSRIVDVQSTKCVAHLHSPPLIESLAASFLVHACNQSMDSWDQSPSATHYEGAVIESLAALIGWSRNAASGVFTSGGTQSNLTGLLLARESAFERAKASSPFHDGMDGTVKYAIYASDQAHFSVEKSAGLLGLGRSSVRQIRSDADGRLDVSHLEETVAADVQNEIIPIAIVATAGTTNAGAIDPLNEIARIANQYACWMHVDAAYGAGLLMSSFRERVQGIELADSVTLDFHKMFFQSIPCSAVMVRDERAWARIAMYADYLNPQTDEVSGVVNLVTRSLQTTRAADAMKLYVSIRSLGTDVFRDMHDNVISLANQICNIIRSSSRFLLLVNEPEISTVIFCSHLSDGARGYCQRESSPDGRLGTMLAERHEWISEQCFLRGIGHVGSTIFKGQPALKFTLVNPRTTLNDLTVLVRELERLDLEYCGSLEQKAQSAQLSGVATPSI